MQRDAATVPAECIEIRPALKWVAVDFADGFTNDTGKIRTATSGLS